MRNNGTCCNAMLVAVTLGGLCGFVQVASANVLTVHNMTKDNLYFEMAEESDSCASGKTGHFWYYIQAWGTLSLPGISDEGRLYASARTEHDDPANEGYPQPIPTDLTSDNSWYVPLETGTPESGICVYDQEPDPLLCGRYNPNTGATDKPCAWTHHFAFDADNGECDIPPLYIESHNCDSGRCTYTMTPRCSYWPGLPGPGTPGGGGGPNL